MQTLHAMRHAYRLDYCIAMKIQVLRVPDGRIEIIYTSY